MSQSVTQCITVDLFPHILANAVDIQKVHLLLHTPLLNKTPRLSSAVHLLLHTPLLNKTPRLSSAVHLLLHTPLLNKTPRLSSARMFVRLHRLLLIHCIYVSVTKPTCPAFSAWLNTEAIRSMKVTGKAIMLCSYGININVMCSTTSYYGGCERQIFLKLKVSQ